jgi:SIR2-like domain
MPSPERIQRSKEVLVAEPVLFVGNGPNYFSKELSWKGVVQNAAQKVGSLNRVKQVLDEPLPLVFEALVASHPKKENWIKRELAIDLKGLKANRIHRRLMALPWNTILTTNYDHCLEEATGERFKSMNLDRESTYSVFRRNRSGSRSIWHLHGDVTGPRTMMLGMHQYAGYLQKLRQYLTRRHGGSPFVFNTGTWVSEDDRHSWADHFLRDDVHIVGLGLDYQETVLWWLLTFKARLRHKGEVAVGTTTYHYFANKKDDTGRLKLMAALGVDTKHERCAGKYPNEKDWEQLIEKLGRLLR